MKALLSLIFLAVVGYLGYYVYNNLTQEERAELVEKTTKTLDKAGEVITKEAKEILKDSPTTKPTEATP